MLMSFMLVSCSEVLLKDCGPNVDAEQVQMVNVSTVVRTNLCQNASVLFEFVCHKCLLEFDPRFGSTSLIWTKEAVPPTRPPTDFLKSEAELRSVRNCYVRQIKESGAD